MISRSNFVLTVIAIILGVALTLSIRSCRNNAQSFSDINTYTKSLTDSIRHLPNNVVSKPVVYITPEAFQQVIDQRDDLKKQLALMHVKPHQVQNITTVSNTITIVDTIIKRDTVAGIAIKRDSIVFRTESDSEFIVFSQRTFLFKKNEFDISVHHTNPHIQTNGLESITLRQEKKWWQSGWIKVGIGFLGGYALFHK